MPVAIVEICNKKGLHARAAAKFVKVVAAHNSQVLVKKLGVNGEEDSPEVQGSSILGLMMFGADCGSHLQITGNDVVIKALKELIENKFGEGE